MKKKKAGRAAFVCLMMLVLTGCGETKEAQKTYETGVEFMEAGKYKEAQNSFLASIIEGDGEKESKLNKKVYYGLGVAYYKQGDYKNAAANLQEALDIPCLETWNTDILKYQIQALSAAGDYEKALEQIEAALEMNGKDFDLLFQKYALLLETGKEEEAKKAVSQALAIEGKGKEYEFNKAKANYYGGDLKKAKKAMNQAVKDEIWEAYFYLGKIAADEKDYEAAVKEFQAYESKAKPVAGAVYGELGNCYMEMGDYENALAVYEKGISAGDGTYLKELRANLIIAMERLGRFEEALERCSAYMEDYPEDEAMAKEYEFLKTRV